MKESNLFVSLDLFGSKFDGKSLKLIASLKEVEKMDISTFQESEILQSAYEKLVKVDDLNDFFFSDILKNEFIYKVFETVCSNKFKLFRNIVDEMRTYIVSSAVTMSDIFDCQKNVFYYAIGTRKMEFFKKFFKAYNKTFKTKNHTEFLSLIGINCFGFEKFEQFAVNTLNEFLSNNPLDKVIIIKDAYQKITLKDFITNSFLLTD